MTILLCTLLHKKCRETNRAIKNSLFLPKSDQWSTNNNNNCVAHFTQKFNHLRVQRSGLTQHKNASEFKKSHLIQICCTVVDLLKSRSLLFYFYWTFSSKLNLMNLLLKPTCQLNRYAWNCCFVYYLFRPSFAVIVNYYRCNFHKQI